MRFHLFALFLVLIASDSLFGNNWQSDFILVDVESDDIGDDSFSVGNTGTFTLAFDDLAVPDETLSDSDGNETQRYNSLFESLELTIGRDRIERDISNSFLDVTDNFGGDLYDQVFASIQFSEEEAVRFGESNLLIQEISFYYGPVSTDAFDGTSTSVVSSAMSRDLEGFNQLTNQITFYDGGGSLSFEITGFSAVPEPSVYATVFGISGALLTALRKRKRNA